MGQQGVGVDTAFAARLGCRHKIVGVQRRADVVWPTSNSDSLSPVITDHVPQSRGPPQVPPAFRP